MANHLIIDLKQRAIRPGTAFEGDILWDLETAPRALRLRLGWWTSGRGDRDEHVVAEREWASPAAIGKESFSLAVPEAVVPSFSGRLISVEWGLQLSARGIRLDDEIESVIVSPLLREIDISAETYESQGKSVPFGKGR
ncbi:MAG: hypothetical protein ACLFRP_00390 [Puniceicoccaceae bacterium]